MRHGYDVEGKSTKAISIAAGVAGVLALLLTAQLGQDAAAQSTRDRLAADAQFTDRGTEECMRCHAGESMTVVAETAHGNVDNPHTPYAKQGCESCHGPGSLHVSRAAGGAGFPALLKFGKDADDAEIPRQTEACQTCHADDMGELEGLAWSGSLHDTGEVTCVSCHQMHSLENPLAEIASQTASCATCHEEQIDVHPRFEGKGIVFDQLACYDCHDVHQLIKPD